MTEFVIPLPPDDLVQVWDKDGTRWMRLQANREWPGGTWREADMGSAASFKWGELMAQFGSLTDFEPRCEALLTLGGPEEFRCLLAPNHSGHHKLPENCWSTP